MREGSYAQIEPGMPIVGRDGEPIGSVDEVLVDEGSGIFVGLTVRIGRNVHPRQLRGELIDRLHEGTVYADAVGDELDNYQTPEERHHEAEAAFEAASQ